VNGHEFQGSAAVGEPGAFTCRACGRNRLDTAAHPDAWRRPPFTSRDMDRLAPDVAGAPVIDLTAVSEALGIDTSHRFRRDQVGCCMVCGLLRRDCVGGSR
jgi:hypothetical protein